MAMPEFRPRFRFVTPLSKQEVIDRINGQLKRDNPHHLWMKNADYHLLLTFQRRDTHAWTPQMDIGLDDPEPPQAGTLVRCLIGPGPGIWMLFMAGYLGATLIGLTGLTLGLAQSMLHRPAWGYYGCIPAVVMAAGLLFLAGEGRRRAAGEMRMLKRFVDEALGCDCFKLAEAQRE
jgi:hypothetical protein